MIPVLLLRLFLTPCIVVRNVESSAIITRFVSSCDHLFNKCISTYPYLSKYLAPTMYPFSLWGYDDMRTLKSSNSTFTYCCTYKTMRWHSSGDVFKGEKQSMRDLLSQSIELDRWPLCWDTKDERHVVRWKRGKYSRWMKKHVKVRQQQALQVCVSNTEYNSCHRVGVFNEQNGWDFTCKNSTVFITYIPVIVSNTINHSWLALNWNYIDLVKCIICSVPKIKRKKVPTLATPTPVT